MFFVMYWTPDRLLIIAIVITLISVDGVYRAWRQKTNEDIGKRLFTFYTAVLVIGSGLAWLGFLLTWSHT